MTYITLKDVKNKRYEPSEFARAFKMSAIEKSCDVNHFVILSFY